MPTYDYVCKACGEELEIFQSITESPKRKCPECGKLKLHRKIGAGAGILFKGSGFYQTDYRTESYKQGESAAKSAEKAGEKAPEKSSGKAADGESKPKSKPKKPASDD